MSTNNPMPQCCCCCDVLLGAKILGWISLVGAVMQLFSMGSYFAKVADPFGLYVLMQESMELVLVIIRAVFFAMWIFGAHKSGARAMHFYEAYKWTLILSIIGSLILLGLGLWFETNRVDFELACE